MKFERLNENQIRCTLNVNDLASRQMELSEIAYGSEKAKELFQDMIEQARTELDFEVEGTPLIVEAVPLSSESLMLIITKVENPEEVDTRYAKFTPSLDLAPAIPLPLPLPGAPMQPMTLEEADEKEAEAAELYRLFFFQTLDSISEAAAVISLTYDGENTLYKLPEERGYCLLVTRSAHTTEEFNRTCSLLSEYGNRLPSDRSAIAYYEEHCEVLIAQKALQVMALL